METITKEYNVFEYQELSENAKEKVQEMFSLSHWDIETDMLTEDFAYQLEEKYPFFSDVKFQWSLSCCQGDGLSFSGNIDLNKYLDVYHKNMKTSVYDALCNKVYNLHSNGNTGRYYYASKSDIDFDYNVYKDHKRLDAILENIVDDIRALYIDVCKDFEKQGYNAYDYLGTDEYAKDTCEANEYTFLEDGKIFS